MRFRCTQSACPAPPISLIPQTIAALLLFCCQLLALPAQAADPGARDHRIGGSAWIGDAPTRIADTLGYFNTGDPRDRDIIRVDEYNSGKEGLNALLENRVDFAVAAPEPVAIALMSAAAAGTDPGEEIVILASLALSSLSHHVVADRRKGIARPGDLTGKRIGLVLDSSAHHAWYQFAAFHGVPEAAVRLIDIPIDRLAGELRAGHIDAAVLWDPWTRDIQDSLGTDARVFSARELHTIDWFLITRRDTVQRRPDIVDRVLEGYLRAINLIYRDPEAADRAHIDAAGRTDLRLGAENPGLIWRVNLGWSVLANLEVQFQWLRQRPEFAGVAPPPPYRYLDGTPLGRVSRSRVMLPAYLYRPPAPDARLP